MPYTFGIRQNRQKRETHMTGLVSSQSARLEALKNKHRTLSRQIDEEHKYPAANMLYLRHLKLQKLRLKEEIEEARRA
jgi:hypothetical protein